MRTSEALNNKVLIKKSLFLSVGWAVFHSYVQFTVLVTEGNRVMPIWFLIELIVSMLASSQLSKLEYSLKIWIVSILLSVVITLGLVVSPVFFGALDSVFTSLIITGSIQPIVTILLISTPLGLLGCFLGQVLRNRIL
jgi:hypothetical protein